MSFTLTTNYLLKKPDSATEVDTWGNLINQDLDSIDTVLANKGDKQISPPVGSIMAWHKNFPNTPALASNWVECNGQTLSDAGSPYNGQVIPDLNSQGRFLRGSSTSGTLQTDQMQSHKHEESGHNHTTTTPNGPGTSLRFVYEYNANTSPYSTGTTSVVLGNPTDSGTGGGTPRHGTETRPVNMSVIFIMRIK